MRLDEIQAAVLRVKLHYLDRWNEVRQAHARKYAGHLQGVVEAIPVVRPWGTHVYCYYVIQVRERERFRHMLEEEGIATGIHYPRPIHRQPACAQYGYTRGTLPVTEAAAERIVSLPMYPELTTEQIETIVAAVKKFSASGVSF
jgi:dTDP-4-amino-4,6-dideoxygalactose transaminase